MYRNQVRIQRESIVNVKNGVLQKTAGEKSDGGRLILKGGRVVDPKNRIDEIRDLAILEGSIIQSEQAIIPEKGDRIIDCRNLIIMPGLLDMHLHLCDLFEVSTDSMVCAAEDGVTMGLSPGAGNTFMAPSLLGAEIDRGVPVNVGVYLGAANVLATQMTDAELISMFRGECEEEILSQKLTRNGITNLTAPLVMGLKEHMGHAILSEEDIDRIYEITSQAGLVFMSHTQDPEHTEKIVSLSKGRPIHLGHVTAAGCGTHADAKEGLDHVLDLIDGEQVTGEFVTSMLRPGGGSREGLQMPADAQKAAYDALVSKKVNILVSDGQNHAVMKGFGDTRDNIPAILELSKLGVLPLVEAVATMTCNPADLLAKRTGNLWWTAKVGHLGAGALANVTIVDQRDMLATYTIVNGEIVSFENRLVRRGFGAGGWVSRFGMVRNIGVGDLAMFSRC